MHICDPPPPLPPSTPTPFIILLLELGTYDNLPVKAEYNTEPIYPSEEISLLTFNEDFGFCSSTFSLAGDSLVESDLLPVDILEAVLFNET